MKVFAYSPSVEVYAAVKTKGGVDYLDLSPDVVSCMVSRKCDAASSFSVKVQNKNFKYNGVFEPFDRISITCTKKKSHKLIVGYITKAPKFSAYGGDVTIEGLCPIYRLQQLYWDPGLQQSQVLLGYNGAESSWDAVLVNLLTKVGGYSSSQIYIGNIPGEAISFAREMYEANRGSMEILKDRTDEFYEILQTHGPKITTTTTTVDGSVGESGDQPISGSGGGAFLTGVDFNMTESQFVKYWGDRIDAWYRKRWSGSPLEGHGATFARAAYKAKFEPRFLPAVSGKEQSGGLVESNLNGNYYGWAVYDSGMGELARSGASGIDGWIYYLLSDKALFAGKPLYQQSWETIAASWATDPGWPAAVMGFMKEI